MINICFKICDRSIDHNLQMCWINELTIIIIIIIILTVLLDFYFVDLRLKVYLLA